MANNTRSTNARVTPLLLDQLRLGFDVTSLILAGLGNGLVMTIIFNKQQKNINDIFILNLAFADVMFVLLMIPGDVFKVMNQFPGSHFYCASIRPLVTMFFCIGVFTITLMAVYRCNVIVNPYQPKMKFRYAYLLVLLVWSIAFVTALPAVIVATVTPRGSCTGSWKHISYKDAYIIYLLLAKCVIPLSLITISYIRIALFLIKNKPPPTGVEQNSRHRIENIKIIKTIAAVVVLFALCTTPHQVGWAMLQFGDIAVKLKGKSILRISPIIQNVHACMNPLIYAMSSKYYRQEYAKYFRKLCCHCCCLGNVRVEPNTCVDFTQQPCSSAHAHNQQVSSGSIEHHGSFTESGEAFMLTPMFRPRSEGFCGELQHDISCARL